MPFRKIIYVSVKKKSFLRLENQNQTILWFKLSVQKGWCKYFSVCVFFFHLHFCKSCSHRAETRQTCALTRPTEFYSLKLRGAELTLTSEGHTYERADKVSLQRLLRAKKRRLWFLLNLFQRSIRVFSVSLETANTRIVAKKVKYYLTMPYQKMFGMTN